MTTRPDDLALSSVVERRSGFEVLTATTGPRGDLDSKGRIEPISIVLMDVMMPEINSYETMQAIRLDVSVRSNAYRS